MYNFLLSIKNFFKKIIILTLMPSFCQIVGYFIINYVKIKLTNMLTFLILYDKQPNNFYEHIIINIQKKEHYV